MARLSKLRALRFEASCWRCSGRRGRRRRRCRSSLPRRCGAGAQFLAVGRIVDVDHAVDLHGNVKGSAVLFIGCGANRSVAPFESLWPGRPAEAAPTRLARGRPRRRRRETKHVALGLVDADSLHLDGHVRVGALDQQLGQPSLVHHEVHADGHHLELGASGMDCSGLPFSST